jgi:hypothetical protein
MKAPGGGLDARTARARGCAGIAGFRARPTIIFYRESFARQTACTSRLMMNLPPALRGELTCHNRAGRASSRAR